MSGGTLLVNNTTGSGTGTGNVTVNGSGTTLGGTGTISGTVTLGNTTAGAVINPGPQGTDGTSASVGTLTVGALTLSTNSSTFHADAFNTAQPNWDQLKVTGTAALGSAAQFQLSIATSGLNFISGTTYVVIDANSITGAFANAAEGALVTSNGYNFTAHYDTTNGDFDLVAIPEPSTWLAAVLTLGTIGFSQRKRVRACASFAIKKHL